MAVLPSPDTTPLQLKGRLEALDGLRGVAAGAVLVSHATMHLSSHKLFEHRLLAVQFFFMLSGFVITRAYEHRLRAGMGFAEFYVQRVIRLYPLIIAGVGVGTVSLALSSHRFAVSPLRVVSPLLSALGLPSPETGFNYGGFPVNPPEWSLFYELLAYSGFGLLIRRSTKRGVAVFIGIATLLYAGVDSHYFPTASIPLWTGAPGAAASFAIGMMLFWLLRDGQAPLIRLPLPVIAAVILAACAIPNAWGWWVDLACLLLVFPLVIAAGASHGTRPGTAFVRWLGEISYPLYIVHWPILMAAGYVLGPRIGGDATVLAACGVAIASAWLALVLYDRPVRRWLSARVGRGRESWLLGRRVAGS